MSEVRRSAEGNDAPGQCNEVSGDCQIYERELFAFGLYEAENPGGGDEYLIHVRRGREGPDGLIGFLLSEITAGGKIQTTLSSALLPPGGEQIPLPSFFCKIVLKR